MSEAVFAAFVWGCIQGLALIGWWWAISRRSVWSRVVLYICCGLVMLSAPFIAVVGTYRFFHDDWGLLGFLFSSLPVNPGDAEAQEGAEL